MPPYATAEVRVAKLAAPSWLLRTTGPPSTSEIDSDDDHLAAMYIRMWSLASGRRFPRGVRPDQLGEDELIAFWADDLDPASGGRHAGEPGAQCADSHTL